MESVPYSLRIGVFEWRLVPIIREVQKEEVKVPWKGMLIAFSGAMMDLLNMVPVGKKDGEVGELQ